MTVPDRLPDPRYARQVRFPEIGPEGQATLAASRVTLVGCGSLGGSIADTLVRAGVGFLRICDRDFVEAHNLQSQVLYSERDVRDALPKAAAARRRLLEVNSTVTLEARVVDVSPSNVESLVEESHLVLDGTDNFETRLLLNDVCVKRSIPWIYGGCVGSYGMTMTIRPGETACYSCLLPDVPPPGSSPTCETAGVILPAVEVVASLQCAEALKILTGRIDALAGGLRTVDVWRGEFLRFDVKRRTDCATCLRREFPHLEARASGAATALCGRNAVQVTPAGSPSLDLADLERRLSPLGRTTRNEYLLKAWLEGVEWTVFPDGRSILHGVNDPVRARSLYAKYVGA